MQQKKARAKTLAKGAARALPALTTLTALPALPALPGASQGPLQPVPGLDYGVLDTLMGYALRRAQNALYLHFQRSLGAQADVSPQRFAALVLVGANPGLRQGVLSEAMGLHRSGGVRLTDWMHAQGWVRREADPADARTWALYLTPAGEAALAALSATVQQHDAALLAALGPTGAPLVPLLQRLSSVAFDSG